MKKAVLLVVLVAFSVEAQSGAASHGITPLDWLKNPALMPTNSGAEMLLWGTNGKEMPLKENYGAAFGARGLGFLWRKSGDSSLLSVNFGVASPGKRLYLGYARSIYYIPGDKLWGWQAGAILRPFRWVSAGGGYDRLPYFDGWRGSIALRPMTSKVTLWGEGAWIKDAAFDDGDFSVGSELHLIDGIRLYGSYALDSKTIGGGLRVDFPNGGIGAFSSMDSSGDFGATTTYIHTSTDWFKTIFPLGKRTLALSLHDIVEYNRLGLFAKRDEPLYRLIEKIDRAAGDPAVKGVVIKIDEEIPFEWTDEIANALLAFRENGKTIKVYARSLGNTTYALASIADEIAIAPMGTVKLIGLRLGISFYKGIFDKLGIVPDGVQIGKYKGAIEPFTRKNMSPELKGDLEKLLDSFYNTFRGRIAYRGNISLDSVKTIIDNGPYTAEDAQKLGIIDTLLYQNQFEDWCSKRAMDWDDYFESHNRRYRWGADPKIAVIFAEGTIVAGKGSSGGLLGGSTIGDKDIHRAVKRILRDPLVKGVVLRISSPGGSAFASEQMWHDLKRIAEEKNISLVVSIGTMAASGGCYIAAAGDFVFVEPSSITGSIGVVSFKPALRGLYDKIGYSQDWVQRGKNAGVWSLTDTFTVTQRDEMRRQMIQLYDIFKSRVAEGRHLSADSIEALAQGKIYSGTDAISVGLADSLGSIGDAIAFAAHRAGVKHYTVSVANSSDIASLVEDYLTPRSERVFGNLASLLNEDCLYLAPPIEVK